VEAIPLFPLGTVLFPGVVLPLHIFEPRYRALIRHLMTQPPGTPREFGVIAIRHGWETGSVQSLYDVGCTAELRQVTSHPNGTHDIVAVGRRRFRLIDTVDGVHPYLCGRVSWLPDDSSRAAESTVLRGSVAEVFTRYLGMLGEGDDEGTGIPPDPPPALPDDPRALSHLIAASAPLTVEDRQSLLRERCTASRLRLELRILKREATMLRRLGAVPVPLADLRVPLGLN